MSKTTQSDLILIDGRSGSGKTTFARDLARSRGAEIIHMDDLYPGWAGLAAGACTAAWLATRLYSGHAARYLAWDWHTSSWGELRTVTAGRTVIIEGCGSLSICSAPFATERYWLEVPTDVRRQRAVARDNDDTWWQNWQAEEDAFYPLHQSWNLADHVIQ